MKTNDAFIEVTEKSPRNQVGIHLDLGAVRVVEVSHGHVKDWQSTPYPEGLHPGAPGFAGFLKKTLADIAGIRHAPVWVVGPLPSLQVRFLSLPRVRPRQISNLVYWTFRKEIPFDAARAYFDYDVEGEGPAPGQHRQLDVTAYTVAHEDVHALTALFKEAGIELDGVMIPSFAMRSVFRTVRQAPGEVALGLFVGEDASSIMFMKGTHVVAHRVFKTGMNAMLDVLRDRHPDWSTARAYEEMTRALNTSLADHLSTSPAIGRVQETVQAAFGRLEQQVERSVSSYLVGRADDEIKTIHVAGALAGLPSLLERLGSRLGLQAVPLTGLHGRIGPRPALSSDESSSPGAAAMTIALGAALADPGHAPNLLHTYVKREREDRSMRARRMTLVGGLAGVFFMLATNAMVTRANQRLSGELAQEQARIETFAPYPDRMMIDAMIVEATRDSARLKNMARRCLPVAALNQLAAHTPRDIRLSQINLTQSSKQGRTEIALEGQVGGEPGLQESRLASYIMRLEGSRLFERVALGHATEGRENREPVLLFNLRMHVEELNTGTPVLPPLATVSVVTPKGERP